MSDNRENLVSVDLRSIPEPRLRRILLELTKRGAFLFAMKDMTQAAVFVRGSLMPLVGLTPGETWALIVSGAVEHFRAGRASLRYRLTDAGRAALARINGAVRPELDATPFAEAQAERKEIKVRVPSGRVERRAVNIRTGLEWLERYFGRSGAAAATPAMLDAAARLSDDFERSQLAPSVTQDWDKLLACVDGGGAGPGPSDTAEAARRRVHAALTYLGPDLSDAAFRVCCFGTGMQELERDRGWAARSGKVVLRIALKRLACHYGIQTLAEMRAEEDAADAAASPLPKALPVRHARPLACGVAA